MRCMKTNLFLNSGDDDGGGDVCFISDVLQ